MQNDLQHACQKSNYKRNQGENGPDIGLRLFESCTTFGQLIQAFNINTNAWCMTYIYKRCKFLNNQMMSQGITLAFLAIWHGFHSGYYLTFFNELLVMTFEKQFFWMVDNSPIMKQLYEQTAFKIFSKVVGKTYLLFFLPHCFMPFALLKHSIYLPGKIYKVLQGLPIAVDNFLLIINHILQIISL